MRNVDHIGIVIRAETPSAWFSKTMTFANLILSCGYKIPNQTSFTNIYAGDAASVAVFIMGDLRVMWGGTDYQMGQALRALNSALLNTVIVGSYGEKTKKEVQHLTTNLKKPVHWFDPADQGVPDYIRLIRNAAGVLLIQSIVDGDGWCTWDRKQAPAQKDIVRVVSEVEDKPVVEAPVVVEAVPVVPKPKRKYTRRKATKNA